MSCEIPKACYANATNAVLLVSKTSEVVALDMVDELVSAGFAIVVAVGVLTLQVLGIGLAATRRDVHSLGMQLWKKGEKGRRNKGEGGRRDT
ncbi:hypothetical protein K440DRAFT_618166 [Wilcoxina mikolae CBS 423.85]|nr:hypothetical protein K440DRAFT_618166 [Wilcoxina mikolae CBS 423.85]